MILQSLGIAGTRTYRQCRQTGCGILATVFIILLGPRNDRMYPALRKINSGVTVSGAKGESVSIQHY